MIGATPDDKHLAHLMRWATRHGMHHVLLLVEGRWSHGAPIEARPGLFGYVIQHKCPDSDHPAWQPRRCSVVAVRIDTLRAYLAHVAIEAGVPVVRA